MNAKIRNLFILVLTLIVLMYAVSTCAVANCYMKDPHDYVPGWEDSRLQFGKSYTLLLFQARDRNFIWINTSPGWYETPDGSNINYVVMCK